MGATASALAKAASAYPDLRPYLPGGASLPDVRTLQQFLDQLELAESAAMNGYRKLVAAADLGIDKQSDYVIYAQLTNAIYKAQLSAIGLVIAIANAATGGVAGIALAPLLTPPAPLPMLTWEGRHASQAGLGIAPVLAVVGVIAAALAALGLVYLYHEEIANMVDDLTTVYVARARAAQQTELLEARRRAMETCMARAGADPEACRAEAVELTPPGVDPGGPRAGGGDGGGSSNMLGYLAIGGVVLFALAGGLYFVFRSSGGGYRYGFRGYDNVPISRVGKLPARAPNVTGASRYNLEVRR